MSKPKSPDSISDIITRRQRRAVTRTGYISLTARILFLVVVVWLLLTQVFLIARSQGNDMFPSVKDGDVILTFRIQRTYLKNDVVSYQHDGKRHIGRIIADSGDVVTLDETGSLRVNGTVQVGEILYPTYAKDGIEYPYRVPQDFVFILGDNRPQAIDSRDFGAIPKIQVEGKLITLIRRRGL